MKALPINKRKVKLQKQRRVQMKAKKLNNLLTGKIEKSEKVKKPG